MNLKGFLVGCALASLFGAASLAAEVQAAQPEVAASVPAQSPWQRMVMIGASATAGFTILEPLGGSNTAQYSLSRYVDAAVLAPHEPVKNLGSSLFFLGPEAAGRSQVDRALKAEPTLVLGIDFLFWFCYGDGATDEERLARFEKGLKYLEEFKCPVVVGDIPDASGAVPHMIMPEQMPSMTALDAANQRLKEWAATRKDIVTVSLSTFMRAAVRNERLTIRGETLPAGKTRGLLQFDRLHPTRQGCALLSVAMLEALKSAQPAFSGDVCWNTEELLRLVFNNSPATNSSIKPGTPPVSAGYSDPKP